MMKIFISHCKEDSFIAEQLKELFDSLTSGLVDTWHFSDQAAGGGMPAGFEWRESLNIQLKESAVVLAIITQRSKSNPWIYWECGVAAGINRDRLILPICYDMPVSEMLGPLSNYQTFNGQDGKDIKRVCQELLKANNKNSKINDKILETLTEEYLNNINLKRRDCSRENLLGNRIQSYEIHKSYVNDVVWIEEVPQRIISVSDDSTIKVLSLSNPHKPISISESNRIKCAFYVEEHKSLIYGVLPGQIKYLKISNSFGTVQFLYEHPTVRAMDFGKHNSLISTGGYNREMRIYELDLNKGTAESLLVKQCSDSVFTVAWSQDNSLLAYSEGATIHLLQVTSLGIEQRATFYGHSNSVISLSWSKDDTYLASGDQDGNVIIWNSISGKVKYLFNRFSILGAIRTVAFHPQVINLVAAGGTVGTLELMKFTDDIPTFEEIKVGNLPLFLNRVRWDASGKILLLACSDTIKIISLEVS